MIQIPLAYKEILESKAPYTILYGGRVGGKSKNTATIAILEMLENPYYDIVVARVNYGSLADSSYAEFKDALDMFGDEISEQFILKRSPLRIERKGNAGTVYFIGYGGSNTSRTKSIKTTHKIKTVIFEETQELKDEENLEQAMASFRRNFAANVRVFLMGNPPPQSNHWFNKYIAKKMFDDDFYCKNVTYLDILPFINDYDLKEILKQKHDNFDYYEWFYLGKTKSNWGSIYPMFRKDKHVITLRQWEQIIERTAIRPVGMVIGLDGAVNNDCTAATPIVLLNNGQTVIGPIFYHNPKQDAIIGYHQLVSQHLRRWVEDVCRRFNILSPEEHRANPTVKGLPIWLRCDSAAPDLIQECRYFFGDRIQVGPIHKGSIMEMVGTCQSAICNDNCTIIDYGGYYNYYRNKWIACDNILVEQITSLIWNEAQTSYDPIIPNDVCDSWTYGTFFWYSNLENIQYFNIVKTKGLKNIFISEIIKKISKGES